MEREWVVAELLADVRRGAAVRRRFAAGAAAEARQGLRQWQAARLARTHADLLESRRYGKAARFFLTDLYGPEASFARYEEAERVMRIATHLLPPSGLGTLADAWQLDAISETLDEAIIDAMGGSTEAITAETYGAAYRAVGRHADRVRQIELTGTLAYALESFARKRYASVTLALMREPARIAGFGDLQAFLERGLAALRDMGKVAPFVELVMSRETRIMHAVFAGDDSPLR